MKGTAMGRCVVCSKQTYDDGEGCDPRGSLGLSASAALVASEFGEKGADVPLCYGCSQERNCYARGVVLAKAQWDKERTCG